MKKKISLHTLGCKVNFAETSQLRERFEEMDYEVVEFGEPTDIVLINTCSVTNNADVEARKLIRRVKRQSPESFVGVLGCYAQLKPDEVAAIPQVNAVFGQKAKMKIPSILHDMLDGEKTQVHVSCIDDPLEFDAASTYDNESRTRAFLKLQDGCNYFCTFCTIPYARGKSRSMAFDKIPAQLRKIVAGGYREVVISGINLGDYKVPTGERFVDVVELIERLDVDLRVRISSIEPNLLTDRILDIVVNSKKFCPHFHIPLQSGSPEILKKMRRRYKAENYRNLIERIKLRMPQASIGADVIVGFPGETDAHFMETYNLLSELPISYLHAFTYSERDNTPAAAMENPVPVNVRKERTRMLRDLSAVKLAEFNKSQVGSVLTAIPEQRNPETGEWKAWTENYVRVKFKADENLEKMPQKVLLNRANGQYVHAELI